MRLVLEHLSLGLILDDVFSDEKLENEICDKVDKIRKEKS